MYWPRLQLTQGEARRWAVYAEPKKLQRAALYRAYAGELRVTPTVQEDTESIQISRRSRVFAMTASGDVHNFEVTIYDSSGEQYTMGYVPMCNLLLGMNADPRGFPSWGDGPFLPGLGKLPLGTVGGTPYCMSPHVFEPNIVLAPNQLLNFKGRALNPPQLLPKLNPSDAAEIQVSEFVHLSFCIHVWEFPLE